MARSSAIAMTTGSEVTQPTRADRATLVAGRTVVEVRKRSGLGVRRADSVVVMRARQVRLIYERVVHIFIEGDMTTGAFVRVFMSIWGLVDPGARGRQSVALHQLFTYLEGLDILEPPPDLEVRREVAGIWFRSFPEQAPNFTDSFDEKPKHD